MAVGWARDGAVQEQIDARVKDAVKKARGQLPHGKGLTRCMECGNTIPEARCKAIPGICLCVECQLEFETQQTGSTGYNRRGSKNSQLK